MLIGEVKNSKAASHGISSSVISPGSLLSSVEGAKPNSDAVPVGVTDLGSELAPWTAANSPVPDLRILSLVLGLSWRALFHLSMQC